MGRPKILIGVTGSVAAVKVPELVKLLHDAGCDVQLIFTLHGKSFITDIDMNAFKSLGISDFSDESEWMQWTQKGDPVLHIDLRKWCDVLVICPLSANTLAKISAGMCDNLLTSVVRAWDNSKPFILCPAMNTAMWNSPFTDKQLRILHNVYNTKVVPPKQNHLLACGDMGPGALADTQEIVNTILELAPVE